LNCLTFSIQPFDVKFLLPAEELFNLNAYFRPAFSLVTENGVHVHQLKVTLPTSTTLAERDDCQWWNGRDLERSVITYFYGNIPVCACSENKCWHNIKSKLETFTQPITHYASGTW